MTPLGWGWAMFVWVLRRGLVLMVNDRAKLLAYSPLRSHEVSAEGAHASCGIDWNKSSAAR